VERLGSIAVIGELAKWRTGKKSPAAELCPKVFRAETPAFRMPGDEDADFIQIDVSPPAGVIPVATLEIGADANDCAADVQFDSL
jgi:hypothetical protein